MKNIMINPPNFVKLINKTYKQKLLLGAGPCNVHKSVSDCMARPLLGHMDKDFLNIMEEIKTYLQYTWQTRNEFTIPVSGTGSAAMEACACNLIEEGDKVLVCANGYFGLRMENMCQRLDANLSLLQFEWGKSVDVNKVEVRREVSAGSRYYNYKHKHKDGKKWFIEYLKKY